MELGKDKLTPEERLLKVLENEGGPAEEKPPSRWKGFDPREKWSQWKNKFFRWKGGGGGNGGNGFAIRLSLAAANRILIAAIALGLILAAVNTLAFKPDLNWVFSRVAKVNTPGQEIPSIPSLKPFEEYLAAINKRNLFIPPTAAPVAAPEAGQAAVADSTAAKMLEDLQLVGIAWGAYPEAMIRDKKENRTHFLKEEQVFKGIKVKQILKDRVIVELGGLQKELL